MYYVIVVYLVLVVYLSVRLNKSYSLSDYFLAGRNFSGVVVGLSILATHTSSVTLLGAPALGYITGFEGLFMFINLPLVSGIVSGVFVSYFYKSNKISVYSILENRFGKEVRWATAFVFFIVRCLSLGAILYPPALILEKLLPISMTQAIFLISTVAIVYTMFGGLKGVIITDVLQLFFTWVGIISAFVIVILKLRNDGISYLDTIVDRVDVISWFGNSSFWSGLIGGLFLHLAYFGCDQSQVQRMNATRNEKEAKISIIIGANALLFQMIILFSLGILLNKFYMGRYFDKSDNILIIFIIENFNPIFSGIFISAIFSAAMSSLDSSVNSLSSVFVVDFYRSMLKIDNKSDTHYLWVAKISIIFIGLFATCFAFLIPKLDSNILSSINIAVSYFYGSLLGVFLLLFTRVNVKAIFVVIGLILGIFSTILIDVIDLLDFSRLYYNAIGCFVTFLFCLAFSGSCNDKIDSVV